MPPVTHKSRKSATVSFSIDCGRPAADGVFDVAALDKFLHDRVKIDGRTANLAAHHVTISRDGDKVTLLCSKGQKFPKKYIKYLLKKYLKKNQVRDFFRPVSKNKLTYELRYFNVEGDQDAESEDDSDKDE
jgi:large subunit ribosomal protein L22e